MANNNDNKKKDPRGEVKLGYHFLPANMKLGYSDGRKAEVGKTLSMQSTSASPRLCSDGMHASPSPAEAARHGKGPTLTQVEVWGDLTGDDGNKFAGRHRKVLWAKTLSLADLQKIGKKAAGRNSKFATAKTVTDAVSYMSSFYSADEKARLNATLLKFAKANGCPNIKEIPAMPRLPRAPRPPKKLPKITSKMVRDVLDVYTVTGRAELERALKGFDLKTLDNAIYGANVLTIHCWKPARYGKHGRNAQNGYVLRNTK
ncbi:MAG: hypothetical protein JO112_20175 [Planctomycetes bacterium]|nr:hypothetical protein [Planctomycetota bacterium]